MERETHLLEINLISAQGLKAPSANLRRLQTYAIAWVDPSAKLRTRLDRLGGENPTWNENFLFRVTPEFLAGETSAVSFEIYAVGYIKDPLVGTVRFLLSSASSRPRIGTPSFTAVQVRRPSGRFHGVLNIAGTVVHDLDFASLNGFSAICFRDLMDETRRRGRRRHGRRGSEKSEQSCGGESCGESVDLSDGADSTTSSSSTTSTLLKDWNCEWEERDLKSDGKALLCGLMLQRKIHLRPSDQNFPSSQQEKENR
ncbi:calcium-dependent lipid-binding (CaLB domain) family protein [Actinidia rufa]|uniref:Calcium-dependent lipid-binding (CaLB domain) family protein n=1 Tax=Actinidia rufa TaxID=165716 RepID=A0A7J0FQW9_9ERIC|nr:calcium-dependent lipid-binding (CaLB domain) family protein [Actinidia rufa]